MLRLDGSSIEDPVYSDGSAYRTAPNVFGVDNPLYDDIALNLTEGMEAGIILHGPCSILAFDGYYYKDLRASTFPQNIEIIISYSDNATALDSDVSDLNDTLDTYAYDLAEVGQGGYPAVVYEYLRYGTNTSHLIVGGEAFYTHYKFMYDQNTENGAYNGGIHYGQMFTNNIINWFFPKAASYDFAFAVIPISIIGVVYVLMKKRK